MTRTKILAAIAAVWSIILVVGGATFRDARPDAVRPSVARPPLEEDSGEPLMKKGDRLPWSAPLPLATAAQPEVAPSAASQPEQLPPATEDDIRQAEAEH